MRRVGVLLAAATAASLLAPAAVRAEAIVRDGSVYARVSATEVVLGNALVERRWARDGLVTEALVDKRDGGRTWSRNRRDFALDLAGRTDLLGSERFTVTGAQVTRLARGGLEVAMQLASPIPGLTATRVADAYPGVAGFRTQTILHPAAGLALAGATLDEAAAPGERARLEAFRGGSDWRGPGWTGPSDGSVGDPEAGDFRTEQAGSAVDGAGEWLTLEDPGTGRDLFMVMERNDLPSSRASYDGSVATLRIDYARDVASLGPVEEQGHVENPAPAPAPGRVRTIAPGADLALAPAFVGFGAHDGDDAWQFHRYLVGHRLAPYPHDVVFNSDGTDSNRISTGAKDDMDYATVQQVAPLARRLGADVFVLDDGWQAASGDWEPDSAQYPEPRGMFPPRFPDATFTAVRRAIAPMKLGLWMSPVNFNPASTAFKTHPQWACTPIGDATAALNAAQPDSSSNEAGIGFWGPNALPFVKTRIEDAIENWGVRFFKFDFLAWFDCAGQGDLWSFHDAFVGMLDALRAEHPGVVFQIDETNDYRLFPFESVSRGPTWFQNGAPNPDLVLHNLWLLSPYIPGFAIGQKLFAGDGWKQWPLDTVMATQLLGEPLAAGDLRQLDPATLDGARRWLDWSKAHRADLDGVIYPLGDDPLKEGWTALQSWNPDTGRGALLAFRQDSADATHTIALRNVPPGRRFTLRAAPADDVVAHATSEQLRQGIALTIPDRRGSRVLLIAPDD